MRAQEPEPGANQQREWAQATIGAPIGGEGASELGPIEVVSRRGGAEAANLEGVLEGGGGVSR